MTVPPDCLSCHLQAPFTYEALPPESINFVPLKQKQSFDAKKLMQVDILYRVIHM